MRPGDCPRCGRFISLAAFASGKRLVCESCGYLSLPLTRSGVEPPGNPSFPAALRPR
jgi:hypothetical protein